MARALLALPPTPLLVLGALLSVGWLLLPAGRPGDAAYVVVAALGPLAAWCAVPRATAAMRPVVQLIACGLSLSSVADVVWFAIAWSGGDPDPSLADVCYLAGYGLLGAALFLLLMPVRGPRRVVDVEAVLDVVTVMAVCALVTWELVVRDVVDQASLGEAITRFELIYPLVDAVLIGLVVRAATDRRSRAALGGWFAAGLALWLAGDFTYLSRAAADLLSGTTSFVWTLGTMLLAAGAVRLGTRPAPRAEVEPDQPPGTLARLLLAVAPLSVPPLLVVVETATGRDPESWSLVVGIMVLIALAFVRTERLLATERRMRGELAVTRDAALEASYAKSAFLAAISHEIRTPMNGVLGLSRLLATSGLDEEQRHYTRGIERAGAALMSLLDDVLDFARFESGQIRVDHTDFDVVAIVEDVAAMVAEQAHRGGVEVVAHCDPELAGGLDGDPTKLRQVLLNLAANAVAFTTAGEVEISVVAAPGGRVRCTVRDTGIGIAPEDQERVFAAFAQVDGSRRPARRGYGGTGLGLAIARSLVEAMSGEIGVHSRPARGSTFWCEIPLGPARQQSVVRTRPSRACPGARVLVVDDNATSRGVLVDLLGRWELDVTAVADGDSALAALDEAAGAGTPYRLALVDLAMPGMDGLTLVERIRDAPRAGCTPVVAMTTGADVPAVALRLVGVEVSVAKPVGVARLQAAVQRALGPDSRTGHGGTDGVVGLAEPVPVGRGVVLVVEDSDVNQLVAVGTLRQLGYLAEVAADGAEAVAMVAERNYDAVLMDCRMRGMDGFEAATTIRRAEEGHRVPIIALTAHADRERCLAAGMDDVLLKPLGRQPLRDALARWVPARPAQP